MEVTIKVRETAVDGLPDMEALVGRVAFIFDGCVVSGWPLVPDQLDDPSVDIRQFHADGDTLWEANEDVGRHTKFSTVTHWLEFPYPIWELR